MTSSIDHDVGTATGPAGHMVAVTVTGDAAFGARCEPRPLRGRGMTRHRGEDDQDRAP